MSTQTWWVTGASSGIGRELVLQLAGRGHHVLATARSAVALARLQAQQPELIIPLPADVSDDIAMRTLWARLPEAQRPQRLDGVILCAGRCEYVDLPELDTAMLRRVLDVNFFGAVNSVRAALPLLQPAADGRKPKLVGIGSLSVAAPFPRNEAYGASKAALHYFFDALRCDVQADVDVRVIDPGFVSTPMTDANDFPMPFTWTADDAARTILRLLAGSRRHASFPWQLSSLLRLARWLPGLWYRSVVPRLARQRGEQST